jgi:hypothetical protein
MDSDRIRTVIEEALSASVQGIQLSGIYGAEMKNVAISSNQLQRAAAQLQQHGHGEMKLSAEVELFLRISNTDVLSSVEHTVFRVQVSVEKNDCRWVDAPDPANKLPTATSWAAFAKFDREPQFKPSADSLVVPCIQVCSSALPVFAPKLIATAQAGPDLQSAAFKAATNKTYVANRAGIGHCSSNFC